ncbi:hypothetical protein C2G38_2199155 [Gigaspora rosea]|uniref:Uncharacterized protein n=1 Tax=Gigaspora rosea TaxID=44941 RepID=A0A397US23_9GLOM|nr:hypothetical protein C2G38_2199155 [Gigaspora rosea]
MNNADGIFELGNCYQNGIDVKKDEYKVSTYFLTSGRYYQDGIRVEKNVLKAFIYYYQKDKYYISLLVKDDVFEGIVDELIRTDCTIISTDRKI